MDKKQTFSGIVDEYDPRHPNSYADFCEQRIRAETIEKQQRLLEKKMMEEKIQREREMKIIEEQARQGTLRIDTRSNGIGRGAASVLPAWMVKANQVGGDAPKPKPIEQPINPVDNMMRNMGYQEGQGLGSHQQGIKAPITAEILPGSAGVARFTVNTSNYKQVIDDNLPRATHVILIKNMVGEGQVDDALKRETSDECSKFGLVKKCVIYEIKENVNPEEKVRIFVEFSREEEAMKACAALNKRYFGGRQISSCYYDDNKFKRLDLKPRII
ncbi:hypothetical protein WA158_004133 [Blastocystis sp. Blastoise]